MSTTQTLVLGAIAGLTIFFGLPMARMRNLSPRVGVALNAVATGILIFLFWDVVSHGIAPVEVHLEAHHWASFAGYAALLSIGFAAGRLLLWMNNRAALPDRTLYPLLTLAAMQFTYIVDFMVMMPLGPQFTRLFNAERVALGFTPYPKPED